MLLKKSNVFDITSSRLGLPIIFNCNNCVLDMVAFDKKQRMCSIDDFTCHYTFKYNI